MRLLLDTHIWLWSLSEPRRVGRGVLAQLKDQENELWLSPISTYEALTLYHKGRFEIDGDLSEWLARATAGTREAPLTHEIALVAAPVRDEHLQHRSRLASRVGGRHR